MASTEIAKNFKNLNPGPLDALRGPYPTVAAANLAIPNTMVLVDGVLTSYRKGKFVEIGTTGILKTYWWSGSDYADNKLVEYFSDLATKVVVDPYLNKLDGLQTSTQKGYEILTIPNNGLLLSNGTAGTLTGYDASPYTQITEIFDTLEFKTWVSGLWATICFYSGNTAGTFLKSYTGDGTGKTTIKKSDIATANYYRVSYPSPTKTDFYIKFIKGDGISYDTTKDKAVYSSAKSLEMEYAVQGKTTTTNKNKDILVVTGTSLVLSSGGAGALAGYSCSGYMPIPAGTSIIKVKSFTSGTWSPVCLYTGVTVGTFVKSFAGDSSGEIMIDLKLFPSAKYYRVSCPDATSATFYTIEQVGDGVSIDSLKINVDSNKEIILNTTTLENAQKKHITSQIIHVGTITAKPTISSPRAITNQHTILDDYDILNRDATVLNNKLQDLEYINVQKYVFHIGKSKRVYSHGSAGEILGISDNIDQFLLGNITDISSSFPLGIIGVREMDNGEIALITQHNSTSTTSGFYKTTDWKVKSGTKTMPTWVRTQGYFSPKNSPQDAWGFSVYQNNIVLSEYTTNDGIEQNSKVWFSENWGDSFTEIFSTFANTRHDGVFQHIHGCCYDPFWKRIWVFPGEAALGQKVIFYSDDKGATWKSQSTLGLEKTMVGGATSLMKFCGSYPLDTGIIVGTDSQPNGIWRINRTKKDYADGVVADNVEEAKRIDLFISNPATGLSGHERTITHIMGHVNHPVGSSYKYPILIACPLVGINTNIYESDRTGIIYVSFDGVRIYELWREVDTATYPGIDSFRDNDLKAYLYSDNTVYIFTRNKRQFATGYVIVKGKILI